MLEGSSIEKSREESEIYHNLSELEKRLSHISASISQLGTILKPISYEATPENAAVETDYKSRTPLGRAIEESISHAEGIIDRTKDMIARIAL